MWSVGAVRYDMSVEAYSENKKRVPIAYANRMYTVLLRIVLKRVHV